MMQSSRPTHPCIYKGKKLMDYATKLKRMDEHINAHPHDHQTVIARLKLASEAYDYEVKRKRDARLKRLAEIKQKLREEDEERYGKERNE